MTKSSLPYYVSKNFLKSEKWQESVSILKKEISTQEKMKRLYSLLKIEFSCTTNDIDVLSERVEQETKILEITKKQLDPACKTKNPVIIQKHNDVVGLISDYFDIYMFLNEIKTNPPTSLIDHAKIWDFQHKYTDMVRRAKEIKTFIDKYISLDVSENIKEIWELADKFIQCDAEYEKLINVQIPRLANVLKSVDEKYKPSKSSLYIRDLLKYLDIPFNHDVFIDFYKQWIQEKTWESWECVTEFKHKDNIIKEMFDFLRENNIDFDPEDIIIDKKSPTLYIYIKWIDRTVVISNLYAIWTHIYPCKVGIKEIEQSTSQELLAKYAGKRINFVLDSGIEPWKNRFIETLLPTKNTDNAVQQEIQYPESSITHRVDIEKLERPVPIHQKIEEFLKWKENITINNMDFNKTYDALISSIKDNRVYVWIWWDSIDHAFGYFRYNRPEEIKWLEPRDTLKVKPQRIYATYPIQFIRIK